MGPGHQLDFLIGDPFLPEGLDEGAQAVVMKRIAGLA